MLSNLSKDVNIVPFSNSVADVKYSTGPERLEGAKRELAKLLYWEEAIQFQIAKEILEIEQDKLYQYARDNDGNAFRTMGDYLPFLLEEVGFYRLKKRQVQEYLANYKVFVLNLGLTTEEIMRLGPTKFTAIREGLAYDRATGAPVEPTGNKFSAETALILVGELRESDGAMRVQDVENRVGELRGVARKYIRLEWERVPNYVNRDDMRLVHVYLVEEGEWEYDATTVVPLETAQYITKRMGAISNLPQQE